MLTVLLLLSSAVKYTAASSNIDLDLSVLNDRFDLPALILFILFRVDYRPDLQILSWLPTCQE
jgi:prepilin signal peptidase PulO-like enzyme (type II secretory pathway)